MLKVTFILNTTPVYFSNWLEKYTSSLSIRETFPAEKGYYVLQRARPQGYYPQIDKVIINGNGHIPDENDPSRGKILPNVDIINFEITSLSSTRIKIDATCVKTPSILAYFIGELLTEIKRLWPEMDENPPVVERYQAMVNQRIQNYLLSRREVATTDVISFEYQHDNTTTDQIDRALEDMSNRWNDKFPCPLWRVHCRLDEYGYVIAGNLWIPENERKDGKAVSDEVVDFGYFELTPHVLVGHYTITADWAKSFFELFFEYLKLYGLPERQSINSAIEQFNIPSEVQTQLGITLAVNSTAIVKTSDPTLYHKMTIEELTNKAIRFDAIRNGQLSDQTLEPVDVESTGSASEAESSASELYTFADNIAGTALYRKTPEGKTIIEGGTINPGYQVLISPIEPIALSKVLDSGQQTEPSSGKQKDRKQLIKFQYAPNRKADYDKWLIVWKTIKVWVQEGKQPDVVLDKLRTEQRQHRYSGPMYEIDTIRKIIVAGKTGELEVS